MSVCFGDAGAMQVQKVTAMANPMLPRHQQGGLQVVPLEGLIAAATVTVMLRRDL